MDTSLLIVIIFAILIIFVAVRFRESISARIKALGINLELGGTNATANQPGIQAKNISSKKGGVLFDDATGKGINAENVDANDDIMMTSSRESTYDPKE